MRALLAVALVVASFAAGCAVPPPPRPPFVLEPFTALRPEHFPGAPSVLSGFAAEDETPMRIGDAALLGLEVHRDGSIERQLLLLEVVDLHWRTPEAVWINGVLQPQEVQTVKIETPWKAGMSSNNYQFSHANGTIKPHRVPKMEAPKPEGSAAAPAAPPAKQ